MAVLSRPLGGARAGLRASWQRLARSPLAIMARSSAYRNLTYAIAVLPLGLAYSALIFIGGAAGIVLLPTLLGIPILFGTVAIWWGLGNLERRLGAWWLRVHTRPLSRPRVEHGPAWQRPWRVAAAYLGSAQTWLTLGYLLLKLPFGLIAFTLVGGLVILAVALLASPVVLAVGVLEGELPPTRAAGLAALLVSCGILIWAAALHAANATAWAAVALIRLMLGQGETAERLEEATATAAREHVRAERAERSRQELIVNVGHELRTPVATIRGHVESLLLGLEAADGESAAGEVPPSGHTPVSAEDLRHHLGIVERETQRLGLLIDELLTLARADSGELRLELAPVPAGDVVEEVYQSVATLARRDRQVTVTRGAQRGLPPALADRQRLVQVLLNLVRNAVAYTPEGGIVAVTAEREEEGGAARVAFSVVDTGAGIAPEDLPHVFERFYRADESRARASGGFGLGLAIVRDLVKAMGGSVEVESEVGEGTRFRVLLPTAA